MQHVVERRFVPMSVMALVAAELGFVTHVALRTVEHGTVLYLAAAADTALVGSGSLWLLARHSGGVRALGIEPRNVLRGLLIATIVLRIGLALLHVRARQLTYMAAGALEVALLATATHAVVSSRGEDAESRLRTAFAYVLPAPAAAVLAVEIRVLLAAARAIRRRPIEHLPESHPAIGQTNVHAVIAMLTLVELPAVHVLLSSCRPVVHVAIAIVHLYALVWLLGDRRLLRETGHRVGRVAVEVELGCRWRGSIPLDAIRSVRVGGCMPRDPFAPRSRARRAVRITPMDPPNVSIRCTRVVTLEGPFGVRRQSDRIELFLDDPGAFVRAIEASRR